MTTNEKYTIVYNRKCKHLTLRSFPKKRYFVCLGCGSDCQFCGVCEKVFTIKTLRKYGGICGKCDAQESQELETLNALGHDVENAEDVEDEDDCDSCEQPPLKRMNPPQLTIELPIQSMLPSMLPFMFQLQPPPNIPFVEDFSKQEIPVSEMRVDKESKESGKEDTELFGTVKNILAEDPQKKLWLVEWDGEDHATWEDFNTIKDSVIFKEYIETQMMKRKEAF